MRAAATAERPPVDGRVRARPLRGRALARRWIVATAAGEFAGFGIPAAVGAATAVAGVPPLPQAALVVAAGGCEGAVLGWAQSVPLGAALPRLRRRRWVQATAAAAAFAWTIGMIPATLGDRLEELPLGVLVIAGSILGALLLVSMGTAQWLVLRRHVPRAGRWVAATAAAWTAGLLVCFAVMSLSAEGQPVLVLAVIGLAAGLGMGVTVAVMTAAAIVRLVARVDERRP